MNIFPLTKTAARFIKPVTLFLLTALTACGLNLAGTDEQENTFAVDQPANGISDPSTALSSSSVSDVNVTPTASSSSEGNPDDVPNQGLPSSVSSSDSVGAPGGTRYPDLDSLTLIICNDQTFYIVPSENSTGTPAGQPDNPSEPAVTPPSSSSASKGDSDTRGDSTATIIVNSEKGEISYSSQKEFGGVTCKQGELIFSYSITTLEGSIIKSFTDYEMTDTESFKNDCISEGGKYESISEDKSQCIISVQGQTQYTDPVWEKYSQMVISHCRS